MLCSQGNQIGPVSYTHLDVYKRQHVYLHTHDTTLLFSESGDHGNHWIKGIIPLPFIPTSFQVTLQFTYMITKFYEGLYVWSFILQFIEQ